MRWLKRDWWKAGIGLAGMLLLLVLMVWVPVSAAGAYEGVSGLATPVTGVVQATPTEDATVAALNKEKLAQEVQQLEKQNEPDFLGWLRTNAAILLSTLVVVIGGLIGLFRWFGDRRSEREKQAEERFQSAVTGLGDEKEGAKIGAAILLRTFLSEGQGYEQFYVQTFDLAVANLRLPRRLPLPDSDPDGLPHPPEPPSGAPLPLTTLSQALIVAFKEAFPLAREWLRKQQSAFTPQALDATGIQLDNAYLNKADLQFAWMPEASMRRANLDRAKLNEANLSYADLWAADLVEAKLNEANLSYAMLNDAELRKAKLNEANLSYAMLRKAKLNEAMLRMANLYAADLSYAMLSEADLSYAKLSGAKLRMASLSLADLSGAKLNEANLSLADLSGAKLSGADLSQANLEEAYLSQAILSQAILHNTDLVKAKLSEADLSYADLSRAKLSEANLSRANLSYADLSGAKLGFANLSGADLSYAKLSEADLSYADLSQAILHNADLSYAKLSDVEGLTKEQLEACKAQGAILREDFVSPSSPSQSKDAHTSSAPSAQESVPPPRTGESSSTSSNQGPGDMK